MQPHSDETIAAAESLPAASTVERFAKSRYTERRTNNALLWAAVKQTKRRAHKRSNILCRSHLEGRLAFLLIERAEKHPLHHALFVAGFLSAQVHSSVGPLPQLADWREASNTWGAIKGHRKLE